MKHVKVIFYSCNSLKNIYSSLGKILNEWGILIELEIMLQLTCQMKQPIF